MQPTPLRLSQALWTAFRVAKPIHKPSQFQPTRCIIPKQSSSRLPSRISISSFKISARSYGSGSKDADIEKKAEEAKQRIEQSLDSRADIAQDAESSLKSSRDETIVHTLPEASSIVHTKERPSNTTQSSKLPPEDDRGSTAGQNGRNTKKYAEWASNQWNSSPLPSQIASLRFRATKRFMSFMDNLQSNIVVAAHHLNDLTGYSGIERLKKEIEAQENAVQAARQHVKDSRERYSSAIANRSATQREVNDLLHRKHAWSPTDLERFTHLYRSDHANEQSEQKAHQTLSEAEAQYEESSTRLAKGILARYHEEQIWSDKIRQMSTWGTWGLMGLNVLLFVVFQIAIEPWRRRRLVRGFEEKVQAALDEKERATDEKLAIISAQKNGDQIVSEAVQKQPEGLVARAAEEVAELIADAVSGATKSAGEASGVPQVEDIEKAAEEVTAKELEAEEQNQIPSFTTAVSASEHSTGSTSPDASTTTADANNTTTPIPILNPDPETLNEPQTWQDQLENKLNNAITTSKDTYSHYSNEFIQQFNDKEHIVLSKRELTTKVLEGMAAGVALTCGVMFVVVRAR